MSSGSGVQDKKPVINLYGSYCSFYPMDERLNTLITNTKGSFVNTFRFGIGSSFSDYEVAKYYFPMSDRFCNPYLKKITADGKDRYMNYLIYDGGSTFSSTYQVPAGKSPESIFTESMVLDSSAKSFPLPLQLSQFGGVDGAYQTASYFTGVFGSRNRSVSSNVANPFPPEKYSNYPPISYANYPYGSRSFIATNAEVPGLIEIDAGPNPAFDDNLYFISERKTMDRDFYKNTLQWLYFNPDITARNGSARFECEQSECYSGYCDKDFYKRSVCENSVTGKDALCMCEKKTTSYGETYVECEGIYDLGRSANATDGLAGKIVPVTFRAAYGWGRPIEVPLVIFNDAKSYGWAGLLQQRESKELQFTGSFGDGYDGITDASECKKSSTCYSDVDYYAITPSFKLNYTPTNIECTNYDNSQTSTTYQHCLKWAPSGDSQQKPVSKTIFWGEERKINETVTEYKWVDVGGGSGVGNVISQVLTPIETSSINSYIGFSTMDPTEFPKSMLAKECGLEKNSDYVVRDTSTFGLYDSKSAELSLTAYQTNWIYALGEDLTDPKIGIPLKWKTSKSESLPARSWPWLYSRDTISNSFSSGWQTVESAYVLLFKRTKNSKGKWSIGDCELDNDGFTPKITEYGWCEACSYSTLAYQEVTAGKKYMPAANAKEEYITENTNGEMQEKWQPICAMTASCEGSKYIWQTLTSEEHSIKYAFSDCTQGVSCNQYASEFASDKIGSYDYWPATQPEMTYLQTKTTEMLKQGVMPVLDFSDSSNWEDREWHQWDPVPNIWTGSTKYYGFDSKNNLVISKDMQTLLKDKGPMIIIVGSTRTGSTLLARAMSINSICPKCLVAIRAYDESDYPEYRKNRLTSTDSVYKYWQTRQDVYLKSLADFFGLTTTASCYDLGTTCNPLYLENIDLIVSDYFPEERVNDEQKTVTYEYDYVDPKTCEVYQKAPILSSKLEVYDVSFDSNDYYWDFNTKWFNSNDWGGYTTNHKVNKIDGVDRFDPTNCVCRVAPKGETKSIYTISDVDGKSIQVQCRKTDGKSTEKLACTYDDAQFRTVLTDMTNYSRAILYQFHKPTLFTLGMIENVTIEKSKPKTITFNVSRRLFGGRNDRFGPQIFGGDLACDELDVLSTNAPSGVSIDSYYGFASGPTFVAGERLAYLCYGTMVGSVGKPDLAYMQYTNDNLDISLPEGSHITSVKVKVQNVTGQVRLYSGSTVNTYLEGNYDTLGGCIMNKLTNWAGSRGNPPVLSGHDSSRYPLLVKDSTPLGLFKTNSDVREWSSDTKYGSGSSWITLTPKAGYTNRVELSSLVSTISAKQGQSRVSESYSRNSGDETSFSTDMPCGGQYTYEFEITYYEDKVSGAGGSVDGDRWGDRCWDKKINASNGKVLYDSYTGFYTYLFANQDKLVQAGTIGVLYKNYEGLLGTSAVAYPDTYNSDTGKTEVLYRGDNFGGLQKGSQYLLKEKPSFIYQKTYALPSVACIPCTDYEIQTGRCKKTCVNGVDCTVKTNSGSLQQAANQKFAEKINQSSAYFAPIATGFVIGGGNQIETVGSSSTVTPFTQVEHAGAEQLFGVYSGSSMSAYVRCPDNLVAEPCKKCSDISGTLSCNITYMNGSVVSENPYKVGDMNYLYGDIIASMPSGHVCCLNDSAGNYTFVKMDTSSSNNAPIVFPENGDPLQDCGLISPSLLAGSFCGIQLPVKDYKRECSLDVGGVVYFTGVYPYDTQNQVLEYVSTSSIGNIGSSGIIPNSIPSGGITPIPGGSST